jgi:prevent-host-death family protein
MKKVVASEFRDHFGKYLRLVMEGNEIIITKNGKEVAKMLPSVTKTSFLSDSLMGVLKKDYDEEEIRDERNRRY